MTASAALAEMNGTLSPEGITQVALETQAFELAQRKAAIYAKSSLVPKEYQNNIGNVLIAENMARRMGADTLMVMQNLYIVHGKPGWSAQFLIGCFNSNGRFSAIKYRFIGEQGQDEWGCQAYCTEVATGDEIAGTTITWQMAVSEGWVTKAGSKWKTMPEQMFRYRAATFLIRSTAPEIGLGLLTKEELEDMEPANGNGGSVADRTRESIEALKERLAAPDNKMLEGRDPAESEDHVEPEVTAPAPPDPDPTDDEAIEAEPVNDELEALRLNVQAALDELPKNVQRDVMQGKPFIKDAGADDLNQLLIDIRKAQ